MTSQRRVVCFCYYSKRLRLGVVERKEASSSYCSRGLRARYQFLSGDSLMKDGVILVGTHGRGHTAKQEARE